jgi:integrase
MKSSPGSSPGSQAFDRALIQANALASEVGSRVRIERRCNRLILRAVLPAKPNARSQKTSQQRISTGLPANRTGLKRAIALAQKLSDTLDSGSFSWSDWVGNANEAPTVRTWLREFELDYFSKRSRSPTTSRTFETEYLRVLNHLDPSRPVCQDDLLSLVLATKPDTRSRIRACQAVAKFAAFCRLSLDVSAYRGAYSPAKVNPRHIPSDDLIVSEIDRIEDRKWRSLVGMIAAYGIRPSEALHISGSRPVCRVTDGKTGERTIIPVYPEWFDRWSLGDRVMPPITGKTNSEIGQKISKKFKTLKMLFRPYDLRHAFARRCFESGISTSIAADLMGHDVRVHQRIYRRWIAIDTYERLFEHLKRRS